jgi:hypothetical protein
MMMLSLLLIPFVLFSACGFPQAPSPAEIELPAQVQSVQTEQDEPAETVPGPAELLYQGQASIRIVTDEGKVIYVDPYVGEGYAVAAIKSGDDIKMVQGNLGYETAAFTLDVYGHVTEQMKRESADRMDCFIKNIAAG